MVLIRLGGARKLRGDGVVVERRKEESNPKSEAPRVSAEDSIKDEASGNC
jgi:hypothetical protein